MSIVQVVVGGQYGSEGKGAIAAALARSISPDRPLLAIRVGGPNAGHTVIGRCPPDCPMVTNPPLTPEGGLVGWLDPAKGQHNVDMHPWRLRHVPVAAVAAPHARLLLAPGSEISPSVLESELTALDAAGYHASDRMEVAESATLLTEGHAALEQATLVNSIGSTGKGIGAGRADRALRRASLASSDPYLRMFLHHGLSHRLANQLREPAPVIQIEGTQGYGLGQHAGFYPHCTSSDCTATDALAQAGISPWAAHALQVWIVFRAYPIRVAGNSGPLFREVHWQDLDLPEEFTTVTQKLRRVGMWDARLARNAMNANGAPSPSVHVALTMADHIVPGLAGARTLADIDSLPVPVKGGLSAWLAAREHDIGQRVDLLGTGPDSVIDLAPTHRHLEPEAVPSA